MTLAMYLLYELGMLFLALGGRKRQPAGRIRD
jgi:Sec-independent protein secretion pathway component TatC